MQFRFLLVVIILISASLISIIEYQNSKKSLYGIISKTYELKTPVQYDSFNPHTDIKLFILEKNPILVSRAKRILDRQGLTYNNETEYVDLLYYLYLLDEHDEIAQLTGDNMYAGSKEMYLSFLYLLPALLYEKMGFSELALRDYDRFLKLVKNSITADNSSNTFQNALFQNRLSIARIKKQFLKRAFPAARKEYYESSYFSTVQNNFFEVLSEKDFLQGYRERGLIRPVSGGNINSLEFDDAILSKIAREFQVEAIPFITYELYAASKPSKCYSWDYYGFEPDCSILDSSEVYESQASQINPEIDVFLHYLFLFKQGINFLKDGENLLALNSFNTIKNMPYNPTLEFLRDDAYLFAAFSHLELQNYKAARVEIANVIKDFQYTISDAKNAGNQLLKDFEEIVEIREYYRQLHTPYDNR